MFNFDGKWGRIALLIAALLFSLSIWLIVQGSRSKSANADENILNIYTWADYMGDDTVANFEKETGIKVHVDTFDANETLFAKLAVGRSGYDIVVPASTWGDAEIMSGLLHRLDKTQFPNHANLDPALTKRLETVDPGNNYLTPYLWGLITVGINVDKVKASLGSTPMPADAWDLVFKPEYISKMTHCGVSVLNAPDEIFPVTLRYLGIPTDTRSPADYARASKLLNSVRPYITAISSASYIDELANGSLCLVIGFNGDMSIADTRAREANNGQHIRALIPKSGTIPFFDTMAIPADAPHVAAAYKWINYIYRPEVQAAIVNKVFFANAIPAAKPLIRPDVAANRSVFLSEEDLARVDASRRMADNATRRLRSKLFTQFKLAVGVAQ